MMRNKKIVGITGGSGCGKSYLSDILRSRGIPVIDADKTAHEIMEKDTPCTRELIAFFGGEIEENGAVNRKKLGKIVFSDPERLKKLNEISHKYILAGINKKIEDEKSDIVCVDGATLIESGMPCDLMIGVLADYETRKRRIMARDSLSEEEAQRRLNAQPGDGFYEGNCDFTVRNDGQEPDIDEIMKRISE